MGFGLLLCGYFIVTVMSLGMGDYSFAAYLIGGMVCFSATEKLKDYNPRFILTAIASIAYVLYAVYEGVVVLDNTFLWGFMPIEGIFPRLMDIFGFVLEFFFHITMLWSVAELATEVSVEKIKVGAWRNLVLVGVWGVAQTILMIFPAVAVFADQTITKILLLYLIFVYILVTFMLHSCYQLICPAGEETGKPMKHSRFEWVNRLNKKFDERSEKALLESLEYRAQKQKKREEKRKSNKKKRRK